MDRRARAFFKKDGVLNPSEREPGTGNLELEHGTDWSTAF
jgi:hypothetical protein